MAHEEIYRELAEAKETGELVAYHRWGDDPSIFLVGRVVELSPTSVTFDTFDTKGQPDDPHKVPLRVIHTLDRGNFYLWRIEKLRNLTVEEGEEREVTRPAEIRTLLEDAAREGWIVTLWTSAKDKQEDMLVLAIGEQTVTVTFAPDAARADGRTMIRLNRIKRVRFGYRERHDNAVHRYGLEHGFPNTDPRSAQ